LKTANLAIVFTDIQGFTERTSQQTLEQNQGLLQVHSDLLRPLFGAFGGKVIKSTGDGFLVTFESPTQAVLCCVAVQDRLWDHNRLATPAERLDLRVAVNVGEVRLDSNDVFGEPVNIAARVEHLAEAGEVFFTEAVYLAMNKAEVPAQEVGAFELKGIPGKIRIYKVPRAPYRVQPAGVPAPEPVQGEQPPFGNLGLSRVQDTLRTEKFINLNEAAASLGATANVLGQKAGVLVGRTRELGAPRHRRTLVLGAGALALLLALVALFQMRGTPLEQALNELEDAPQAEREGRIRDLNALIAAEPDRGQAAFAQGRLDELLNAPGRAARTYGQAAKLGNSRAEGKLLDFLEHPDCRVRETAADVVADLRLRRAKGALEDLAENGGPGEDDRPFIGCNSRRAAQRALETLR